MCDGSRGNGCEITKKQLLVIKKSYSSGDTSGNREKKGGGNQTKWQIPDQTNMKNKTSIFIADIINQGKTPDKKETVNRKSLE